MDKKKVRLGRPKELLRLHKSGQLPNLVFSDEKLFQIEMFVKKQHDPVYLLKRSAENLQLLFATRTQAPRIVMVCTTVMADRRSPIIFIDCGGQNKCRIL